MTQILEAVYDGAVFHPARPLSLEPNTRVTLIIEIADGPPQTVADLAGHLFGIIDVEGPSDLSTDSRYLEGFGE